MKTLTLKIPENVNENEVKLFLAAYLFDSGVLSSGQAAEFANISKRKFLETVGKFGVSIFNESFEEIQKILNE